MHRLFFVCVAVPDMAINNLCRFHNMVDSTTLEKLFWETPYSPTFNAEKVAEVDTCGKNACLFQHCVRGRGEFWNSLNLREIFKYFFHHCLNIWSSVETFSYWRIKLSTTLFLFWKLPKQTFILICEVDSGLSLLLLWLLSFFSKNLA